MGSTGRDLHIDAPLTNLVQGFSPSGLIVDQLFPITAVNKQSNLFYKWEKDDFFRIFDTQRAPKTSAKRITSTVTSETYFCNNYALGTEISDEDIANSDNVLRLMQSKSQQVAKSLMMDWENRVASLVTNTSNVGSSTTLSGTNQWSDFTNSDPLNDVEAAKESIRSTTGLAPNVMVLPQAVWSQLRQHPKLTNTISNVGQFALRLESVAEFFGVDKILVPSVIKNTANEGGTASFTDIWGKDVFLGYIENASSSIDTASYGYTLRWNAPQLGGNNLAVERWRDPNNRKFENIEVGMYQDEKVVSSELGYLIKSAVA